MKENQVSQKIPCYSGKDIIRPFIIMTIVMIMGIMQLNAIGAPIQQQLKISGTVTDKDGTPLPGATVVVKGTTQGTVTDANGNYTLLNVSVDGTLVFSFVGMKSQEVTIGDKSQINVTLQEESIGIDEVVAIGYGTVKKSDLTGAVSSLKEEDFNDVATSVEGKIVGRIAGVRVMKSSSEPGGALTVQIRGAGSITAGNQPLYVIDGIPIETNQGEMNRGKAFTPTWTPVNPLSLLAAMFVLFIVGIISIIYAGQ